MSDTLEKAKKILFKLEISIKAIKLPCLVLLKHFFFPQSKRKQTVTAFLAEIVPGTCWLKYIGWGGGIHKYKGGK